MRKRGSLKEGYEPPPVSELSKIIKDEHTDSFGPLHAVISVSLTGRELEIVNRVAEQNGLSRSQAIRLLIRRGWAYTRLLEDEERLKNEPSA